MLIEGVANEYKTRITKVVNFILQNLNEDLSLQKLADIAQYSPFHFQKIFKQVVSESPKQYVIRMRLETAAHALVMYRHKTITEIAFEHGFSSSAVFARAFKNYFGVSSEDFRSISRKEAAQRCQNKDATAINHLNLSEAETCIESLNIRIQKISSFRCVFVNAKLYEDESIDKAFRKVGQLAETYNLISANSRFAGAIYLHSGIYRTMIITAPKIQIPTHLNTLEVPSAKYAVIDLAKGLKESIEQLKVFADFWLPKSGYRIAEIVGYEMLAESPLEKSYQHIKKEIYIPIEPAF